MHEEAQHATLPEASTLSGGRSSVLRPQVSLTSRKLPMLIIKQQASLWAAGLAPHPSQQAAFLCSFQSFWPKFLRPVGSC